MQVRVGFNDSFPITKFNEKDHPKELTGILDGFFVGLDTYNIKIYNSYTYGTDLLETDDGSSYAIVPFGEAGSRSVLKVEMSAGEAPLTAIATADLVSKLGLGNSTYVGIANIYLGVNYEESGDSKAYIFTDDASVGTVNSTTYVSSEMDETTIDTFVALFTTIGNVRKVAFADISGAGDIIEYNQYVERLRVLSLAKLRAGGDAKYISYDDGNGARTYELIVIGQIFIKGDYNDSAQTFDSWVGDPLAVDGRNYYLGSADSVYILHDNINYGGYQKALLDLQEQILTMQVDGLLAGKAYPKLRSVNFEHLDRDDLYFTVAKGAEVLSIDNEYRETKLNSMTTTGALTSNAHMIKRYLIPTRILFDTTGHLKYPTFNFEFDFERRNISGIVDGDRDLGFVIQVKFWKYLTSSLSSRFLLLPSTDPYYSADVMTGSITNQMTYKSRQALSFGSFGTAKTKNSIKGGFKIGYMNQTDINNFENRDPEDLGASYDLVNQEVSSGVNEYGTLNFVMILIWCKLNESYIDGEWYVNRINSFMSSDETAFTSLTGNTDPDGRGWGLRMAQ